MAAVWKEEFFRLLREDPTFREEVRRQVLTDDLLQLPGRVEQLRAEQHEGFRRVWEAIEKNDRQIASLTERMDQVETQIAENSRQIAELRKTVEEHSRQIAELRKTVEEHSRQIAELRKTVEEHSRQIAELRKTVEEHSRQIAELREAMQAGFARLDDRIDRLWDRVGPELGLATEERAVRFFRRYVARRGFRLLSPFSFVRGPHWEIDGVAEVESPEGRFWLILEAKGRVGEADIWRFTELLQNPDVRGALWREYGLRGRVEAWVYARRLDRLSEKAAREAGVGLIDGASGRILVEAVPLEWESGSPDAG